MTHLCVAIYVQDVAKAKRDIALSAESGADLVELRIDTVNDAEPVREIATSAIIPCIVTCRPEWEGGLSQLTDEERLKQLEAATIGNVRYIDLELKTLQRVTSEIAWGQIIASSHDFKGRPPRISNIVLEMNQSVASINKLVWMARSIRDNIEAFELLQHRQKPTIALCMGEAGLISRVLAKKFGAFLTFASLRDESATAPGQVTIADMKRLYRWDALNPQTKVYGVVGSPIMHSMSPAIHNAAFETVGHDGVYLPMLVQGGYESFKAFMESFLEFAPLDLSGLSVTIPHKENAVRYLKEKGADVEPLAEQIGAVNTIIIERTGDVMKLRGINTDYAAILDTITSALGMHPNVDASPFGDRIPELSDRTLVFDTVYNPMETKLLKQAKSAGAKTVGGVEMFVRQAVRQFEAWTGQPAPVHVMRRVIEDRLQK